MADCVSFSLVLSIVKPAAAAEQEALQLCLMRVPRCQAAHLTSHSQLLLYTGFIAGGATLLPGL